MVAGAVPVLERQFTATILNMAALSDAIDLEGLTLTGIYMPAAWTTAGITFQADEGGAAEGTYQDVVDSAGSEKLVAAQAAVFILLDPSEFIGLRRIKIRSGTTGTPVNQAADRSVILVARPL